MASNDEKEDLQAEDTESVSKDEPSTKKKKKKRAAGEDPGSKDRNKRVREQAARKMEEAKERSKSRASRIGATGLDTSEMMDDALARGFAAFTRWVKNNRRAIEFSVGGLILAGAGYAAWDWYSTKTRIEASAMLMEGTINEQGVVEPSANDTAESSEETERMKDVDPRPRFETYDQRREEALRAYRATADEHSGTGAGILARLGEAGVLLERRDFDSAIKSLDEVLATELARADESVRMSAKERMAMALEGKGDEEGAMGVYKEVAGSSLDYYKNLGLYHQARLLLAKDNKDEAKDKLDKLKDRLKGKDTIKTSDSNRYLTTQVDALSRVIDPSAVPVTGGGDLTPEKLRELQQQLEKMRKNAPELTETPPPPPAPASGQPEGTAQPPGPASGTAQPPGPAPEPAKAPPEPPKAPAPPASAEGK